MYIYTNSMNETWCIHVSFIADEWVVFFKGVGFAETDADAFAKQFYDAKIRKQTIESLDDNDLKEIAISAWEDRKFILCWVNYNVTLFYMS